MIETTFVLYGRKASYKQGKRDIVTKVKLQDNQKIDFKKIYGTARENGYTEFSVEWLLEEPNISKEEEE